VEQMNIRLNYEFICKKAILSWNDILYGVNNRIISSDVAIEHAVFIISKGEDDNKGLLELASLYKGEDIHPHIDKLAEAESVEDNEVIIEKWLYLLLTWIYENRENYDDPLSMVEQLYGEFDYPDSIINFVRYMPTDEPSLGSLELNEARLYDKWKDYLNEQKGKFTS